MRVFLRFQLERDGRTNGRTDGPTDRWTNRRTDKASYRVAYPQLKRGSEALTTIFMTIEMYIHIFDFLGQQLQGLFRKMRQDIETSHLLRFNDPSICKTNRYFREYMYLVSNVTEYEFLLC